MRKVEEYERTEIYEQLWAGYAGVKAPRNTAAAILEQLLILAATADLSLYKISTNGVGHIALYKYRRETDEEVLAREAAFKETRRKNYEALRSEFEGEVP